MASPTPIPVACRVTARRDDERLIEANLADIHDAPSAGVERA
jgi:hypothetical protein